MNKVRQLIDLNRWSYNEFALHLGRYLNRRVNKSTVYRWYHGLSIPRHNESFAVLQLWFHYFSR